MDLRETLNRLLPIDEIPLLSGEDIVERIASHMYEGEFLSVRENLEIIPELLKDIILIIDFDTELTMNGIVGFLENSSGIYFSETLDAFKRIELFQDLEVLNRIKSILLENGVMLETLREHVNNLTEYQVASFFEIHGNDLSSVFHSIENEADQLYLYRNDDIFKQLFHYVEANKEKLITT